MLEWAFNIQRARRSSSTVSIMLHHPGFSPEQQDKRYQLQADSNHTTGCPENPSLEGNNLNTGIFFKHIEGCNLLGGCYWTASAGERDKYQLNKILFVNYSTSRLSNSEVMVFFVFPSVCLSKPNYIHRWSQFPRSQKDNNNMSISDSKWNSDGNSGMKCGYDSHRAAEWKSRALQQHTTATNVQSAGGGCSVYNRSIKSLHSSQQVPWQTDKIQLVGDNQFTPDAPRFKLEAHILYVVDIVIWEWDFLPQEESVFRWQGTAAVC